MSQMRSWIHVTLGPHGSEQMGEFPMLNDPSGLPLCALDSIFAHGEALWVAIASQV